jgi:hypothetical protein
MKGVLYLCDRCNKGIGCTTEDPAVITRLGKMHFKCMKKTWAEQRGEKYVETPVVATVTRTSTKISEPDTTGLSKRALGQQRRRERERALAAGVEIKEVIETEPVLNKRALGQQRRRERERLEAGEQQ